MLNIEFKKKGPVFKVKAFRTPLPAGFDKRFI
jgi:hypothetical protein